MVRFDTSIGVRVVPLAAFILAIFTLDTLTNLEIAVAVLYVAVVLLSARVWPSAVLPVSGACIAATLASFVLTARGTFESGLINACLSLLAIVATSYLSIEARRASESERAVRAMLAEASRAASLGELASMIAHEINQPLAAIASTGNAAARWVTADPPNLSRVREALTAIASDTERAAAIVTRIRSISAGRPFDPQTFELNQLVAETVQLCLPELRQAHIDLATDLGEDLPATRGDPVQLQQVLLNLISNARESIDRHAAGQREIVVRTKRLDADNLLISVRDSGDGIKGESAEKIFEPFFSTKHNGTGLGLAICRSLVEAHGGKIWSEPADMGAVFNVSLPLDPVSSSADGTHDQ